MEDRFSQFSEFYSQIRYQLRVRIVVDLETIQCYYIKNILHEKVMSHWERKIQFLTQESGLKVRTSNHRTGWHSIVRKITSYASRWDKTLSPLRFQFQESTTPLLFNIISNNFRDLRGGDVEALKRYLKNYIKCLLNPHRNERNKMIRQHLH